MRNFAIQSYLSYRALFLWLNWPSYIGNIFLTPVMYMVMLAVTGRFANSPVSADFYIKGMAAYSIPFILHWGITQCFFYDRAFGTLSVLFGSSGNRWLIYWSRGSFHFPNGILTVVTTILFAWAFLELDLSKADWVTLSCSILLVGLSCTASGLFVGVFTIVFRDWIVISAVATGVLLIFTGVVIPIDSLPTPFNYLGQILPLTHGLVAFREGFAGASVVSVGEELFWELAVGFPDILFSLPWRRTRNEPELMRLTSVSPLLLRAAI